MRIFIISQPTSVWIGDILVQHGLVLSFDIETKHLRIYANGLCEIKIPYQYDGCTGAPELQGTTIPAGFHDAWYEDSDEICKALNITLRLCLDIGDDIFYKTMKLSRAKKWVRSIYYWTVQRLGYWFRLRKKRRALTT
jgi:hypothetical protein